MHLWLHRSPVLAFALPLSAALPLAVDHVTESRLFRREALHGVSEDFKELSMRNTRLSEENQRLRQEVELLRKSNEHLMHRLAFRCPQLRGPWPLDRFAWNKQGECVNDDLLYEYSMNGKVAFGFEEEDQEANAKRIKKLQKAKERSAIERPFPMYSKEDCQNRLDGQIGGGQFGCTEMQRMSNTDVPFWSSNLINGLVDRVHRGEDISPKAYPNAATDNAQALAIAGAKNKSILVVGSISPWLESIILASGATGVHSVDYNPPKSDHPQITSLGMDQLLSDPNALYELVISFSSLEHDGLGRYGDPFNPLGDFAAIREMARVLKPGGILLLGVPTQFRDAVAYNSARVYGPVRTLELHKQAGLRYEGFLLNGIFHMSDALPLQNASSPFWQHDVWAKHPIQFLRKPNTTAPSTSAATALLEVGAQHTAAEPQTEWSRFIRKTDQELGILTSM